MRLSRQVVINATDQGTHVSIYAGLAELQRKASNATGQEATRLEQQILEERRRIASSRQAKGRGVIGKVNFSSLADYFLPESIQTNYNLFSNRNLPIKYVV